MAAYKAPRVIEFVEALPKSGSGKIMWRQLQELENAASEKNTTPRATAAAASPS
jgi:fatty-acyl-CoA synthase